MNEFEYHAPASVQEATSLLAEGRRSALLAGGTDILVQLRETDLEVDQVVDVKRIPELVSHLYSAQDGLALGAAVPCFKIYSDSELISAYPALIDATRIIGGWQIQGRASVGGNLCNSSPAADTIAPLLVHDATCVISSSEGERRISAAEFCTAPGKNRLETGELLVQLMLPPSPARSSSAYERFIPRYEMDIAVAGAASYLQLDESGKIADAKIALSAVAPTVRLAEEAAQSLIGKSPSDEVFSQAGELAKTVASPISDMRGTVEFRTHLASVLTRRTLKTALERIG